MHFASVHSHGSDPVDIYLLAAFTVMMVVGCNANAIPQPAPHATNPPDSSSKSDNQSFEAKQENDSRIQRNEPIFAVFGDSHSYQDLDQAVGRVIQVSGSAQSAPHCAVLVGTEEHFFYLEINQLRRWPVGVEGKKVVAEGVLLKIWNPPTDENKIAGRRLGTIYRLRDVNWVLGVDEGS